MNGTRETKGKQIVAEKPPIRSVYRLLGRDLYLFGIPNEQFHQLVAQLKQKEALKKYSQARGWTRIEFIDDIPTEDLYDKFFNAMIDALKKMGFTIVARDL